MKKLTAILIILIFSFESAGYCLPCTRAKRVVQGLRVPIGGADYSRINETNKKDILFTNLSQAYRDWEIDHIADEISEEDKRYPGISAEQISILFGAMARVPSSQSNYIAAKGKIAKLISAELSRNPGLRLSPEQERILSYQLADSDDEAIVALASLAMVRNHGFLSAQLAVLRNPEDIAKSLFTQPNLVKQQIAKAFTRAIELDPDLTLTPEQFEDGLASLAAADSYWIQTEISGPLSIVIARQPEFLQNTLNVIAGLSDKDRKNGVARAVLGALFSNRQLVFTDAQFKDFLNYLPVVTNRNSPGAMCYVAAEALVRTPELLTEALTAIVNTTDPDRLDSISRAISEAIYRGRGFISEASAVFSKTSDSRVRRVIVKAITDAINYHIITLTIDDSLLPLILDSVCDSSIPEEDLRVVIRSLRDNLVDLSGEQLSKTRFLSLARETPPGLRSDLYSFFVEPLFFKVPELFDPEVVEAFASWKDIYEASYLRFWSGMHQRSPPIQTPFIQAMASGPKRVLVVHNIQDGQGDELIRNCAIIQALLDLNPQLEVVLYTGRSYLYTMKQGAGGRTISSHPRVQLKDISKFSLGKDEHYDMVVYYGQYVRGSLDAYFTDPRNESTIRIVLNKQSDGFNFKEAHIGRQHSYILPKYIGKNVYVPGYRLLAELGLPFRFGSHAPKDVQEKPIPPFLVFQPYPAADSWWQQQVETKRGQRRVAIFNGFGGMEESKGFRTLREEGKEGRRDFAAAVRELIEAGYFVVMLPNHQKWGTPGIANEIRALLPEELQPQAVVAPGVQEDPFLHKYLVAKAGIVYTVEGGLMHLAYFLGKTTVVIPMDSSGKLSEWMPPVLSAVKVEGIGLDAAKRSGGKGASPPAQGERAVQGSL